MADLANDATLQELYNTFQQTRAKIVERLRSHGGPVSKRYTFSEVDNDQIQFDDLFQDRSDLLVVHNMGKSCRYCTLWADGLNGMLPHLTSRTAVVLVSPDSPSTQREFAESRGWNIRMVSDTSGTFTDDMNFAMHQDGKRYVMPGVSAFHRDANGQITHVSSDFFGPGDTYMPVFPLFELLLDGASDWQPQYSYSSPVTINLPNIKG